MPDIKESLKAACNQMLAHTQELCLLDTGIGDGDHGLTTERGFLAAAQAIDAYHGQDDAGLFAAIGEAMSKKMGGAIGPLYGVFWRAVGKAVQNQKLTGNNLGVALQAGCEQVMKLGRAVPGDKTLVDAMLPCTQAVREGSELLAERLHTAAQAAMEGAQSTRDMMAKKGRARFLQEKSIGHVDAGAYSFALFMGYWAQNAAEVKEA